MSELNDHIAAYNDLLNILNALKWDMRVMMPPGGARTRGMQLETLTKLAKAHFVSDTTARLLDRAEAEIVDSDSLQARALEQTRRYYEIQKRIPADLQGRLAALAPESETAWAAARQADDFAAFQPYLEKMLSLNVELAEAIGYEAHPFDALILQFEPGMAVARLETLFGELKAGILPLMRRIAEADADEPPDLWQEEYAIEAQAQLCHEFAELIGFDFERGRLDIAPHPFEISFTRDDVRITTRYDKNYLPMALFATLHEAGHGLYEQHIAPELTRSALTSDFLGQYAVGGASYGAHEFSSRLWENQIGRSRDFWKLNFGRLRERFPTQLRDADAEVFYRAVNRVRPSLIRVEADEVSYNLHIMLRTELEIALLDGSLSAADLPDAWNAKMVDTLGISPPNDRLGVLQDVHWSAGSFGNFPCYTIGNIMAAQIFAAAREQLSTLDADLAAGEYRGLLAWLSENFYRHGRAYSAEDLLLRGTGEGLNVAPLLDYLNQKYSDVYQLASR